MKWNIIFNKKIKNKKNRLSLYISDLKLIINVYWLTLKVWVQFLLINNSFYFWHLDRSDILYAITTQLVLTSLWAYFTLMALYSQTTFSFCQVHTNEYLFYFNPRLLQCYLYFLIWREMETRDYTTTTLFIDLNPFPI